MEIIIITHSYKKQENDNSLNSKYYFVLSTHTKCPQILFKTSLVNPPRLQQTLAYYSKCLPVFKNMSVVIPPHLQQTSEYYSRTCPNLSFDFLGDMSVTMATEGRPTSVVERDLADGADHSTVCTVPCYDEQMSRLLADTPWLQVAGTRTGSAAVKPTPLSRCHVHQGRPAAMATTSPPRHSGSTFAHIMATIIAPGEQFKALRQPPPTLLPLLI